jgi:hypothetical protein
MQHALGSLAAATLAAGMLAWLAGPLHANGPVHTNDQFVNDPNVRVFTPTPRIREPHEPVTAPTTVVVHVVTDGAQVLDQDYATLGLGIVRNDRFGPEIVRKDRTRRGFGKRGFRADWSFGTTHGFRADWLFGTSRGFKGGKSLHGSRGFKGGKSLHGSRGFKGGRSVRGGRSLRSGRSFTSRGGFGGGRAGRAVH